MDIFDMSPREFADYLAPTAIEAVQAALDNGLYISYPQVSNLPGFFIHEYKDGKKELIEIDIFTGKELFISSL